MFTVGLISGRDISRCNLSYRLATVIAFWENGAYDAKGNLVTVSSTGNRDARYTYAKDGDIIYGVALHYATGEMKMGNYFVMSMRFNKCSASDFGFISNGTNTAMNPNDNSIWIKVALYDFGWGKENGFYKAPLPSFDTLFELALYSTDRDDMYGAAAIILENFADELLCRCEMLVNDRFRKKSLKSWWSYLN